MIKKLSIFLIAALMVASVSAQPVERSGSAQFAPRAGQWQVNLVLGKGLFFPQENSTYLLPPVWADDDMGLPGGETPNQSGDPAVLFHIGSLNDNPAFNMAGIQGKYFVTNRWEVNAMFSMDIGVQPQRHYGEGWHDNLVSIAGYKYVLGRLTNNWMAAIGSNYYFNNCNGRIFPYLGAAGGFQHSRIQTTVPWTGEEFDNYVWADEVYAYARGGEVIGITGAFTAGVEYNLLPGLNMAFEVRPFHYMYSIGRQYTQGQLWNAHNHSFKFFALPQLKLGIRF